jgi:adenylate cyclase
VSRVGRADATTHGPIAVGGALHTGEAYVGPTGPTNAVEDFTALGDVVNTTARLASAAAAGELFVSVAAAEAAGEIPPEAERRTLDVRGREASIDVFVLRPTG